MTLGPAHALPALLLEDADLRPARLTFDDCDDLRIRDKRRARQHFAPVFFDEQHAAERYFRAGFAGRAVERRETAGGHAHLAPAGLDDCVHICTYPKPLSYSEKGRGLLQQDSGAFDLLGAERAEEVGDDAVHQLEIRGERGGLVLRVIERFFTARQRGNRRSGAAVDEDELRTQHEALALHVDARRDDAASAEAVVDFLLPGDQAR